VSSKFHEHGQRISDLTSTVEDHALAQLEFGDGHVIDLACSWNLHAGREAVISAAFYGTKGGISLRNLNGSFYDLAVELLSGTDRQLLTGNGGIDREWGGRAAVKWAINLSEGARFDLGSEEFIVTAELIDAIYSGDQKYRRKVWRKQNEQLTTMRSENGSKTMGVSPHM
jgi:predicted dehydrogenase